MPTKHVQSSKINVFGFIIFCRNLFISPNLLIKFKFCGKQIIEYMQKSNITMKKTGKNPISNKSSWFR